MSAGQVLAAGLLVHMDLISSYSRNQESKKGTGMGGCRLTNAPSFFFSPFLTERGHIRTNACVLTDTPTCMFFRRLRITQFLTYHKF